MEQCQNGDYCILWLRPSEASSGEENVCPLPMSKGTGPAMGLLDSVFSIADWRTFMLGFAVEQGSICPTPLSKPVIPPALKYLPLTLRTHNAAWVPCSVSSQR